jgi:hypothetical protein
MGKIARAEVRVCSLEPGYLRDASGSGREWLAGRSRREMAHGFRAPPAETCHVSKQRETFLVLGRTSVSLLFLFSRKTVMVHCPISRGWRSAARGAMGQDMPTYCTVPTDRTLERSISNNLARNKHIDERKVPPILSRWFEPARVFIFLGCPPVF